jgi:DMSO/TMAO reductase YedYZ molybdopterin-dependent catalytic subunit
MVFSRWGLLAVTPATLAAVAIMLLSGIAICKPVQTYPLEFLFGGSLSLGALTLQTGCDISDHGSVQPALALMPRFNDRVQAAIFGANKLAPTFSEAEAVKNFRYNAWYGADKSPKLSATDFRLQLAGLIADKQPWTVEKLFTLPQVTQITRHVCVEG